MSKLGVEQRRFTRCIGGLIEKAYYMGYALTFGDAYRDPRVPYGHDKSTHRSRLAVDFNIFKDGVFLEGAEADKAHGELHDYWDTVGGSKRIPGDLNHYSFEWKGVR